VGGLASRSRIAGFLPSHSDTPGSTGNSFLDALPAGTRAQLLPMLSLAHLDKGVVLAEPGRPIDKIYFPVRSVISTVSRMADGNAVEVGLAGHEGMSALSVVFGSRTTPHMTVVQISDSAHSMNAQQFLTLIDADEQLKRRVMAYAEYTFTAAAQFAACNRLHQIEERYARWILMAADRVGEEFVLTQEYSAQMLGVRRPGVTLVAGTMSRSGLIAYHRGRISVLDRERLEETACECYALVNAELLRLMGYAARRD
jgi:CRP-like cAMP-binding protein